MVSTRLLKTHAAGFAELNRLYASLYVTLFANLFSAFQALHFSKKLTKYFNNIPLGTVLKQVRFGPRSVLVKPCN